MTTYRKNFEIETTKELVDMLVAVGRLRWSQRADPLAIGKAVGQLLDDWEGSGKTMRQFCEDIKREKGNETT